MVISESLNIRPCIMLPEDIFGNISFKEYLRRIEKNESLDYTDEINIFERYLKDRKKSFIDMRCIGFSELL